MSSLCHQPCPFFLAPFADLPCLYIEIVTRIEYSIPHGGCITGTEAANSHLCLGCAKRSEPNPSPPEIALHFAHRTNSPSSRLFWFVLVFGPRVLLLPKPRTMAHISIRNSLLNTARSCARVASRHDQMQMAEDAHPSFSLTPQCFLGPWQKFLLILSDFCIFKRL